MSLLGPRRLRAAWGGRMHNFPVHLVSRGAWVWVRRQDARKLGEGLSLESSKN